MGSIASRLEPLRGGSFFLPLSSQKFLVLILSTSEGDLNRGPLDLESSALTTRFYRARVLRQNPNHTNTFEPSYQLPISFDLSLSSLSDQ